MRINLSSGGIQSSSFMEWAFIVSAILFLGIFFPGWYSFISIPISLLIIFLLYSYFKRFKEIEFNETHFFIKSMSGNKEVAYPISVINSIVFTEFFLEKKMSYKLELTDSDGSRTFVLFTPIEQEHLDKFVAVIRSSQANAFIDVQNPFDKASNAINEWFRKPKPNQRYRK